MQMQRSLQGRGQEPVAFLMTAVASINVFYYRAQPNICSDNIYHPVMEILALWRAATMLVRTKGLRPW